MSQEQLIGFLNCDKPIGMTSRDVVNVIQRRVRPVKVGHAGTLDPLAEGVLMIGVGPAVRLVPYVQQLPKHYCATFRLGESSISGDLEGETTKHPDLPVPDRAQLDAAAVALVGTIEQTPPAHSAIWVDGQRAYKRIRSGEDVEMPTRQVVIDSLHVTRYDYPEFDLDIVCGSGTYIRTLGIDLAKAAGSISVMSYLRRVAIGPFEIAQSVSLEELREAPLAPMLLSLSHGVAHLPQIEIDAEESVRLGNGLCLDVDESTLPEGIAEAAAMTQDGRLRAIIRPKRGAWCPYRVFPLE